MSDKLDERLAQLGKIARDAIAVGASEAQALSLIADCRNGMVRMQNRARSAPGFERFEIRQINGPNVEFTGRLLCETTLSENRAGLTIVFELYETAGGALVAVSASNLADGSGHEDERATIIKPNQTWTMEGVNEGRPMTQSDETQAMRFAVMDAFGWRTEAKAMVRKKLGWDLRVEID